MDPLLLRVYQGHVASCCKAVLFGATDVTSVLSALEAGQLVHQDRLWYGVQNLIVGAGNLSKTLWGTGSEQERQRRYTERQPLRDSLSATDDSPLRRVKIRNDYEHLDERIEEWWKTTTYRNVVDAYIGPRGYFGGNFGEKDTLRWLEPTSGDVIFWGNELNIPTVAQEAERILLVAEGETPESHSDSPPHQKTSGGGG